MGLLVDASAHQPPSQTLDARADQPTGLPVRAMEWGSPSQAQRIQRYRRRLAQKGTTIMRRAEVRSTALSCQQTCHAACGQAVLSFERHAVAPAPHGSCAARPHVAVRDPFFELGRCRSRRGCRWPDQVRPSSGGSRPSLETGDSPLLLIHRPPPHPSTVMSPTPHSRASFPARHSVCTS